MVNLEQAHWFLRDECNLKRCAYCFGPISEGKPSLERDFKIAQSLVDGGVKKVIFGGGEPTLAKTLEPVMEILKKGDIEISLHTNGLLLTEDKLNRWIGLVDDIALPIDAVNRKIQSQLREERFINVFDNLIKWVEKINARGIKVGWHTVFTSINDNEIPKIYKLIQNQPFEYWRIYEYNSELARQSWLTMKNLSNEEKIEGLQRSMALNKIGTVEKGGTDSLLADFLRMGEKMENLKDKRIEFVSKFDISKEPYAFFQNNGDVSCYAWYGGGQRKKIGNLFDDGFQAVEKRWVKIKTMEEFDESDNKDRAEADLDVPLWVRLRIGSYFPEELEKVSPKYEKEMEHLADLWEKHGGWGY